MRKISMLAILMACMMNAFASNGNNGYERFATQADRPQQWAQASQARDGGDGERRGERQGERGGEQRSYGQRADERIAYPDDQAGTVAQEPRRGSKMSPEERRALRRQINEARDLYSPKR